MNSGADKVCVSILLDNENYTFPEFGDVLFNDCIFCSRLLKSIAEELITSPILQGEDDFHRIRENTTIAFSRFGVATEEFKKRAIAGFRTDYCIGRSTACNLYLRLFDGV